MAIAEDVNRFLDPILATFADGLRFRLNGHLATTYLRGSAEMVEWGRTKLTDKPIFYEGPPMRQAMEYAEKHVSKAKLVDGITAESKGRLSEIISDGVRNKRGVDGIARDLRMELGWQDSKRLSEIKGLSLRDRSIMIARTETADALEQSFIDRAHDLGITGKEWVVFDPCEVCEQNEGIVIGIDETFPTGHDRPPAHPNCMCALAPVMIE